MQQRTLVYLVVSLAIFSLTLPLLAQGTADLPELKEGVQLVDVMCEQTRGEGSFTITIPDNWLTLCLAKQESEEAAHEAIRSMYQEVMPSYPTEELPFGFDFVSLRPELVNDDLGIVELRAGVLPLPERATGMSVVQLMIANGFIDVELRSFTINGDSAAWSSSANTDRAVITVFRLLPEERLVIVTQMNLPPNALESLNALMGLVVTSTRLEGEELDLKVWKELEQSADETHDMLPDYITLPERAHSAEATLSVEVTEEIESSR